MTKDEIQLPAAYLELLQRKRYSPSTIKAYCSYFREFLSYFKDEDIESLGYRQINDYLLYLIQQKKISVSQPNQRINAIKFFYEKVLHRKR